MNEGPIYTAALVGCGRIGYSLGLDSKREQPASHTMALNGNARVKLIAGCDSDAQTLCTWHSANPQATIYRDSIQMYSTMKPDIVVVAVNECSHEKESLEAIVARPRLVILEKPVALSVKQALKIKTMANRNGVPVMVNHERRFSEDYILVRQWMKTIGPLQSVQGILSSGMAVYNPREENSGAYSLIHDGTHLVDIVQFLLEEDDAESEKKGSEKYGLMKKALSLSGKKGDFHRPLLRSPIITGLFRDEKNCVRQVSAHYSTKKCPDVTLFFSGRSRYFGFELDIRGTEGRICVGNGYLKLYRRQESRLYSGFYSLLSEKINRPEKTGYFSNMIQNAVDFLDKKVPLGSSLQDGIDALMVLEEIKNKIT